MPVHPTGTPGCFQWGGHGKVYCGRGAREKAGAQGRAAYAHGYRGAAGHARIVVGQAITYDLPHPTHLERRGSYVRFRDERGLWNVVQVDAQGLVQRPLLEGGSRAAASAVWDAVAGERAAATRAVVPQPAPSRYGPQPSSRTAGPTPARGGWRQMELRVGKADLKALGVKRAPPHNLPAFVIYKMQIDADGKVTTEVLRDHLFGEAIWYSSAQAAEADAATFAEAYAAQQPRNPNAIRVLDLAGRCIHAVVGVGMGPGAEEVPCADAPALGIARRGR
jgi:hypothetical protein